MRNGTLKSALVLSFLAAGAVSARAAGSEDDFKAAYAAADAANKEAGKLRNQWTTTASTLAAGSGICWKRYDGTVATGRAG